MSGIGTRQSRQRIAHMASALGVVLECCLLAYFFAGEPGPVKVGWYAWALVPFATITLWLIVERRQPILPATLVVSIVSTSVGGPALLAESYFFADPQGPLLLMALPIYQLALQAVCFALYLIFAVRRRCRARRANSV